MKTIVKKAPFLILLIAFSLPANAEIKSIKKIPISPIAIKWNKFVDDLLVLSSRLTQKTPHVEKHRTGGYSGTPKFYNEIKYVSKESNLLTSTVQWEAAKEDIIHSIEVFLRNDEGLVTKDFSASYLTTHHNAPIQTLITLHYYNKGLHGFRVFDASHNRIYEQCRGQLNNIKVNIDLDDDYGELADALENKKGIMSSAEYLACFGGRKVDTSRLKIPKI